MRRACSSSPSKSADHPVEPGWRGRSNSLQDHGGRRHADEARGFTLAHRLHPHALCARADRADGRHQRYVRDRHHWDRFEAFHRPCAGRPKKRSSEATGRTGTVSTRFTHVYPDGPAVYYTFNVRGDAGRLIEQWRHHQDARLRRADRRGRHDHPPPRGRARPYALVSRPTPGPVRQGARGGEERARPGGDHEPRGAGALKGRARQAPGKQMDIMKHTVLPLVLLVSTPVFANPEL